MIGQFTQHPGMYAESKKVSASFTQNGDLISGSFREGPVAVQ